MRTRPTIAVSRARYVTGSRRGRRRSFALLPIFALMLFAAACENSEPDAAMPAESASTIAFVDVTVIPMDRERELRGYTVLVADGCISALGPADEIDMPQDALRVDGTGRYLMPGLAEMHAHIPGFAVTLLRFLEPHLFDVRIGRRIKFGNKGAQQLSFLVGIKGANVLFNFHKRSDQVSILNLESSRHFTALARWLLTFGMAKRGKTGRNRSEFPHPARATRSELRPRVCFRNGAADLAPT